MFKKFVYVAAAILGSAALCFGAATYSSRPSDIGPFNSTSVAWLNTVPETTTATEIPIAKFFGGVIYAYDITCTDDDAVDFTLYTHNGSEMESITTTAATDGEAGLFSNYLPANGPMKYKLENVSAGTCNIELTLWRR